MSDIREGDLVMVVRPLSCGCADELGIVFTVTDVYAGSGCKCKVCGQTTDEPIYEINGTGDWIERSALKKIPPLVEPTHHEHTETA